MKTLYSIFVFLVAQGFVFTLAGFGSSHAFASTDVSGPDIYGASQAGERIFLAQHGGPPESRGPMHGGQGKHCPEMSSEEGCQGGGGDCRGPRHGGRGKHCSEMSHEGGCPGGKGGCPGRKGMGHRGGMGRGMHHGGGQSGPAQCPQPRTTVKAPEEFYNRTNPVENTPDNIEQGRLLFQLDAQPTCVLCHGGQGDGTGGFGANLNPPPRNFTCSETMKGISDGQLFWIIRNGSPDTGMPPFQDFQDEQIWSLINFIRSLAR
jgi:cbb3-type cytochrome c oxidase subunit III